MIGGIAIFLARLHQKACATVAKKISLSLLVKACDKGHGQMGHCAKPLYAAKLTAKIAFTPFSLRKNTFLARRLCEPISK